MPTAGTHVFVTQAWLLDDTPIRLHSCICIFSHSKGDQIYNKGIGVTFVCQVSCVHTITTFVHPSSTPPPVIYNDTFCHRLGTSPRPLSPLRNAPPRQMEAHQYLSADPIPDSSDGSRRRAQRAHDQAQQSYVSQASIRHHSSNVDCNRGLIRCIGVQLICQHSP